MNDPKLDALRRAAILAREGPITVTDAAFALGIPGKNLKASAQRLRRMDNAGILPAARRSLVSQDRYWSAGQLAALRAMRRDE